MEPHPQGTAKETKRHEGAFGANAVRLLRGPSCASWWESRRAPRRRAVQHSAKSVARCFTDPRRTPRKHHRSAEHTSELQSLMRISSAVLRLKKIITNHTHNK